MNGPTTSPASGATTSKGAAASSGPSAPLARKPDMLDIRQLIEASVDACCEEFGEQWRGWALFHIAKQAKEMIKEL
jgi:hypothetical protein